MLIHLLRGPCDPYLALSWRQLPDLCLPANRVSNSRVRSIEKRLQPRHEAIDV